MKKFSRMLFISCFIVMSSISPAQNKQSMDSLSEKNIVIVLDNSGSMKQNDPDRLTKTVVKNFINRIGRDTKLAVLVFDKDTRMPFPLSLVASSDLKLKAEKSLDAVDYGGMWTDIPVAIERAIYELKMNSKANSSRSIILLTDGFIDTGDKRRDAEKLDWLKNNLTEEAKKENIKIFGIAFTEGADFQLMQLLAQKTGGDYYRALTPKDIEPVFNKVYEKLVTVKPTRDIQAAKENQSPNESMNYLIILAVVIVVIVGVIAIIVLMRNRSARQQVIIQQSTPGETLEVGPVPAAKLVHTENKTQHIIKKPMYSIGRKKENDLCIPVDTVSGTHAFIKYRGNKFFINDNHSSNSTYINGRKIDPGVDVLINHKDEIRIDVNKYTFELPKQEENGRTVLRKVDKQAEGGTVLRQKEIIPEKPIQENIEQKTPNINIPEKKDERDENATALKQMYCPNHPAYKATELCPECKKAYCKSCMVEKDGKAKCKNCADKIRSL